VALLKTPGVVSAEVSLDKAEADITLAPGNKITIPQLRQLLRKNGYPTRDAHVVATGKILERNGTLAFDLLNGVTLDVAAGGSAQTVLTNISKDPAAPLIEATAVSRLEGKRERFTVLDVRRDSKR
jgi:hypothetical protein